MPGLPDNTDFLNEIMVHPKYEKRDPLPPKEEKKKEEPKKEEIVKKPSKDDQMSLF